MEPPPDRWPWASSSIDMYPSVRRVLRGAGRAPSSVDTRAPSTSASTLTGVTNVSVSVPDESGLSTPVELSVGGITASLAGFRMPDPSRRTLVIPPGLEVTNDTSSISDAIIHGLDKLWFDFLAVKIIAAAKKAASNNVEFIHYLVAAGLEEEEAREINADIRTYPA